MKIDSSTISLSASSAKTEQHTKTEYLEYWNNNTGVSSVKNKGAQNAADDEESGAVKQNELVPTDGDGVKLDLSEEGSKQLSALSRSNTNYGSILKSISDTEKLRMNLLQMMMERLTGKKMKFASLLELKGDFGGGSATGLEGVDMGSNKSSAVESGQRGWGMVYRRSETYYESEQMEFSAKGVINTADGKTINIDLEVGVSREFMYSNNLSVRLGDADHSYVDPLVINFDAQSADLTDTKIRFDIDCDGNVDEISTLKEGSGFLALDKNGDGTINDGSELFGTKSGDGFADLAAYDEDGNGWIDENDKVYDKLRIWATDASGERKLFALGQKGVGAIYLGNVQSEYSVTGAANNENGKIRQSGIFLRENGVAGTVQHLDLTV